MNLMQNSFLKTFDIEKVDPGDEKKILYNPIQPARLINLAVDRETALAFRLLELRIGLHHQLAEGDGISLFVFASTVAGSIRTEVAVPGIDVLLKVKNITDIEHAFHVVLVFEAPRDDAGSHIPIRRWRDRIRRSPCGGCIAYPCESLCCPPEL